MTQILARPQSGDRLLFASFQAGQVGMLDVSDPEHPVQSGIVSLGVGAGPHDIGLTDDDKHRLRLDTRFQLDFNTAFATGPARPHGMESKVAARGGRAAAVTARPLRPR